MFGSPFTPSGGGGGVYVPTITAPTVNVNYITPFNFNYIVMGGQVMFNGLLLINSLAIGATTFYMSLPTLPRVFATVGDANTNGTSPVYGMIGSGQPEIGGVRILQYFYSPIALTDMYTKIVGGYRL